ncbi:MAG: nitroreductase family protein [Campylobacterales bacterium]
MSVGGIAYHQATEHSWFSVRQGNYRLDWSLKPNVFKEYPPQCRRVAWRDTGINELLRLAASLRDERHYPGVSYFLRVQPSAGALYPNELYLQCRGVEGIEDGLYYYAPHEESLVQLAPLDKEEGIKAIRGVVFCVTGLYYRSSWKYRNRALRYLYLDTGHLLGALEAAAWATNTPFEATLNIDAAMLSHAFGCWPDEWPMALAVAGVIEDQKITMPHRAGETFPSPDRFVRYPFIEEQRQLIDAEVLTQQPITPPKLSYDRKLLKQAILTRRSIRAFEGRALEREAFETILSWGTEPLLLREAKPPKLWSVVNHVKGLRRGIYRDGDVLVEGDFRAQAGYLALEQALGSESGVTFFMSGSGKEYKAAMISAGWVGQRLYLAATLLGVGASGIGAYYDAKVQSFLNTDDLIYYTFAIGY